MDAAGCFPSSVKTRDDLIIDIDHLSFLIDADAAVSSKEDAGGGEDIEGALLNLYEFSDSGSQGFPAEFTVSSFIDIAVVFNHRCRQRFRIDARFGGRLFKRVAREDIGGILPLGIISKSSRP